MFTFSVWLMLSNSIPHSIWDILILEVFWNLNFIGSSGFLPSLATVDLVLRPCLKSGCSVVGVLIQTEGRTVKHRSSLCYRGIIEDMEMPESGRRAGLVQCSSSGQLAPEPLIGLPRTLPDRHHGPMVLSVPSCFPPFLQKVEFPSDLLHSYLHLWFPGKPNQCWKQTGFRVQNSDQPTEVLGRFHCGKGCLGRLWAL